VPTTGDNKGQRQTGNESRSHGILLPTSISSEKSRNSPEKAFFTPQSDHLTPPGKGRQEKMEKG
jgi:hypothetical protein